MSNIHPPAMGAMLTDDEIALIAAARYRRFYWEYGRPLWNEPHMEHIRKKFIKETREVIDALEISGMRINKEAGLPETATKLFTREKGAALATLPKTDKR